LERILRGGGGGAATKVQRVNTEGNQYPGQPIEIEKTKDDNTEDNAKRITERAI
jgi:hypothetical protein